MKQIALAIALGLALTAYAQSGANPKVSVTAKGDDVNGVLGTVFAQAKKSYVIQPDIHFALFLSLDNADYEKALHIICEQANLKIDLRDGIYYIKKAPARISPKTLAPPKPVFVSSETFAKKVTTHLPKTDIRKVFTDIGTQAGVRIEVSAQVPDYKVDAFLVRIPLRQALDELTKAASLTYKSTDHGTIQIIAPQTNHVALVKGS